MNQDLRNRAEKMIPEVKGTRRWGCSRKRVPECLKGAKTIYKIIAIAEKQSKRSKKVPFSLGEVGGMPKLGQSRKSRLLRHGKEWNKSVHGDLKL